MQVTSLDVGPHPHGGGFCLVEAASEVGGYAGGDNPQEIAAFVRILGRRLNDAVDDEVRATFVPFVEAVARARRDDEDYADRALAWLFKGPMKSQLSESCGTDVAAASEHPARTRKRLREAEQLPASDKKRAKKIKAASDNHLSAVMEIQTLVEAEASFVAMDSEAAAKLKEPVRERLVIAGRTCGVEIDLDCSRPTSSRRELLFHLAGLSYVLVSPLLACTAIVKAATHPATIDRHPPAGLLEALLR